LVSAEIDPLELLDPVPELRDVGGETEKVLRGRPERTAREAENQLFEALASVALVLDAALGHQVHEPESEENLIVSGGGGVELKLLLVSLRGAAIVALLEVAVADLDQIGYAGRGRRR